MNTPATTTTSPARTDARRWRAARRCLALLAVIALAASLGLLVRALPAVGALDRAAVRIANGGLDGLGGPASSLALGIDVVFGPLEAAALMILAVVSGTILRRSGWAGVRIALLIAVPWGIVEMVKILVRRPRPDSSALVHQLAPPPDSFSFPSGHTGFAAALCLAIVFSLPVGRIRRVVLVFGALVVLATAWSRVAIGLHHPTDVLASVLLVAAVAILLARLLDVLRPDPTDRPGEGGLGA